MNNLVVNIFKIIGYGLMVLAIVFELFIIYSGDTEVKVSQELQAKYVDPFMVFSYIALFIAIALAVIMPAIYLMQHPSEAKETVIGIGGLLLIFGLAYVLASGDGGEQFNMAASDIKMVDAGLIAFYLLGAGALLATVYSEVSKFLK